MLRPNVDGSSVGLRCCYSIYTMVYLPLGRSCSLDGKSIVIVFMPIQNIASVLQNRD